MDMMTLLLVAVASGALVATAGQLALVMVIRSLFKHLENVQVVGDTMPSHYANKQLELNHTQVMEKLKQTTRLVSRDPAELLK